MMLAAAGLAISPVASNAATSLSIVRAAPHMLGISNLQDDDNHHRRRTAMYALGGLMLVLLVAAAAIGSSSDPVSP